MSAPPWTLEQAEELVLEQALDLLDGCDDDDTVRPALVIEALRQAWSPNAAVEEIDCTAGELRERIMRARQSLAAEVWA